LEAENVVTITDGSAKRKSQNLPTLHGLERRQTSLLPVAGELFFLDSPFYRTALLDSKWTVSDKSGVGSRFADATTAATLANPGFI